MDHRGLTFAVALLTGASLSTPALASDNMRITEEFYVGIGPSYWYYTEDELDAANAVGGRLMAGALITERIGVEGHFMMSGSDRLEEDRVDVDLESLDSLLLRLNGPVFSSLHFHALAGFSTAEVIVDPDEVDVTSESASGFSIGAGFEVRPVEGYALTVDYVRYLSEPNFTFQATTASFKWRF
ncbi:MAG: outer membrane beta-barrel protein [Pseudomonadota bacterium]